MKYWKNRLQLGLLLGLLVSGVAQASEPEWKLVWNDEFEKEGAPDPKKWGYEVGFIRNKEKQYYTKGKNAKVEKGCLVIEARKEVVKNPKFQQGSKNWRKAREKAQYTSAALITEKTASWKYGRFEIRAKVPKGKGMWPAIWMMGIDRTKIGWPECGEIDILEQLGRDPLKIHGTVHWAAGKNAKTGKNNHASNGGKIISKSQPSENFHVYAVEWDANTIRFFFDGKCYHTFKIDKMAPEQQKQFRKPYYLLINLALGGSWGGELDDKALPQKYLIDYVRVYQKEVNG